MLKFSQVNTPEAFEQWKKFASEFNHETDRPMLPIVTISNEKGIFADYTVFNYPVLFPAFHPDKTTPRLFKEAIDAVSHSACIASMSQSFPNGVAYAALPCGKKQAVESGMIYKVGYEPLGVELYQRIPQ